jgi:hypothetical protein
MRKKSRARAETSPSARGTPAHWHTERVRSSAASSKSTTWFCVCQRVSAICQWGGGHLDQLLQGSRRKQRKEQLFAAAVLFAIQALDAALAKKRGDDPARNGAAPLEALFVVEQSRSIRALHADEALSHQPSREAIAIQCAAAIGDEFVALPQQAEGAVEGRIGGQGLNGGRCERAGWHERTLWRY